MTTDVTVDSHRLPVPAPLPESHHTEISMVDYRNAKKPSDDNGGEEKVHLPTVRGNPQPNRIRMAAYLALFVLYNVFLAYACYKSWHKTINYCDGVKLLVLLTATAYATVLNTYFIRPFLVPAVYKFTPIRDAIMWEPGRRWMRILMWLAALAIIATMVASRAWHQPERLISVAGYFGFILLGYICSVSQKTNIRPVQHSPSIHQKHRPHINWQQVLWGFAIQLLFGIFVLRTGLGQMIFLCIGGKVNTFLAFTKSGTRMVFGHLITGMLRGTRPGNYSVTIFKTTDATAAAAAQDESEVFHQLQVHFPALPMEVQHSIFALTGLPVIIFFSFFVSILYHYGVMQIIVKKFGSLLQTAIGTTPCESISASGNIFLGMCESPLLVKPFLPLMTKSELHAIMTGGFATIAGSVMAAYISFGIPASHLLSASVMAAPSALALSKLFYPETEKSRTSAKDIKLERGSERNAIEAGSNGAIGAVSLIANILANLIAFVSFLTFLDAIIQWFGAMIELPNLSFKMILSKLFIPVAMMLGVEWTDSDKIAGLIGVKMFINEFVAYQELGEMIEAKTISTRSQTIATFALCGFANLSSIGIQIGTLSTLAPGRASDLAEMAFSAMITGSVACFMTACVAGMLI